MNESGRSDSGEKGSSEQASGDEEAGRAAGEEKVGESEWQRRRHLAAVFGDVLPDVTTDEQPTGEAATRDGTEDAWWREQVPPHHGG